MTDTDLTFLDIETLGLHLDAPIWEFAAVRRFEDGTEDSTEFQIRHNPNRWLADMPEQFRADYDARYRARFALDEPAAAVMIHLFTRDAIVVGCNPSFDTERLAALLRRNGTEPQWHYRPICVSTLAYGWLNGVAARAVDEARMRDQEPDPALANRDHRLPWSSDQVADAVGVDTTSYARHTAMGDVRWAIAQWDTVMDRHTSSDDTGDGPRAVFTAEITHETGMADRIEAR